MPSRLLLEVLLLFLTLFERHQHRCSIYWQSDYSQFFRVFLASVNQQMEEATNNWKKTYHYDYKAPFRLLELIPCFGNADSRNRNENSKWQCNELLKRERRFYNDFRIQLEINSNFTLATFDKKCSNITTINFCKNPSKNSDNVVTILFELIIVHHEANPK